MSKTKRVHFAVTNDVYARTSFEVGRSTKPICTVVADEMNASDYPRFVTCQKCLRWLREVSPVVLRDIQRANGSAGRS